MGETQPNERELTQGVWVELLDEGAILVVRVATIDRAAIDCLDAWLRERLDAWDERQPWLALYDLTTPGAMLTPYIRRRITEFSMLRPDIAGRSAFVMRREAATSLFSLFQANMPTGNRVMRIWHDRQQALTWLRELL